MILLLTLFLDLKLAKEFANFAPIFSMPTETQKKGIRKSPFPFGGKTKKKLVPRFANFACSRWPEDSQK
jgi:hypothetical protein